jgi:type II secretory pathway component PulF
MPQFEYRGVDRQGRVQAGSWSAANELELETYLRARGLWLLDSRRQKVPATSVRLGRVSRVELIQFCTLLCFQTRVGIPLVQALESVAQEGVSPAFVRLVQALRTRVESGVSLSVAMEEMPRIFPRDLVYLVRSGEQGGSLPESFTQAKAHLEWQERVAAEVRQATLYPMLVLTATVGFILILFTWVVPKFVALLTAAKVPLPGPTRFVFALSSWAQSSGWLVVLAIVGAVLALRWLRGRSSGVALALDRARMALPMLGGFARLVVMTRFAHNLALLYRNGVALPQALELLGGVVGSPQVMEAIKDVRSRVLAGTSLSEAMQRQRVFPSLLIRLVNVGERTGQLDHALEELAGHYQELLPRQLKRVLGLLEPSLILGLVVVVGTVALAVILPVLSLMQGLR